MVMNVPFTRMNEAMRMVQRMGGKITAVSVNGGDLAQAQSAPARKKVTSEASKD
jgi:phycocyanin-associated rod protein